MAEKKTLYTESTEIAARKRTAAEMEARMRPGISVEVIEYGGRRLERRGRWAAARAAKAGKEALAPKPKRKMSAAGRAVIIAATKKRWARFRKQKAAEKKATAA